MNIVPGQPGGRIRVGMLVGSISTGGGGVGEAVRSLALALRAHGAACEIFSLGQPGAEMRDFGDLPVHLTKVTGPAGFGYAPGLMAMLLARPLDVLHVHGLWMYPSIAARRWSAMTGQPYLVSPHGMLDPWALANSSWKKRIAWRLYEGAHLRSAKLIHALCEAEREAVSRLGLSTPEVVIPNGVDHEAGLYTEAPWAGRLPPQARVLLFLGRVTPKKRVAELMRAWPAASRGHEAWHLVIVGPVDEGYRQELEAILGQAGPDARVYLAGPAYGAERAAAYAGAAAFILPSLSEGLPMAALEAFSHGLPALLTRQCNLPEAFAAGCAIEIAGDEGSIARGVSHFLSMSDERRDSMGEAARRLVADRFDWDFCAARFRMVYSDMLAGVLRPL